jgi:hypothetical protein
VVSEVFTMVCSSGLTAIPFGSIPVGIEASILVIASISHTAVTGVTIPEGQCKSCVVLLCDSPWRFEYVYSGFRSLVQK